MLTADILSQVKRIEIRTGKMVSETFAGDYLSVFKGHGMEFAEVREYTPGDDIRSIDWNVTARLGKPFVKRFVEERELTVILACDISGSQNFGSRGRFKSRVAAELSALFSFAALQNNDKVSLMLFSDKTELFIPPKKGRKHALRILRELLAYQPQDTGTDIGSALDNLNRMIKRRSILILISDFMDRGFEQALKLSSRKHDLIPVMIEDPLEKELPEINALLETEDPETGQRYTLDLSSRAMHREMNALRQERKNEVLKLFKNLGISPIMIDPEKSIADPVIAFFRERSKRIR